MPSWAPDGSSIYFVRTANGVGRWPASGSNRDYQLTTPSVMRVKADGSEDPVQVLSGKVTRGGLTWHAWIREPVLSPDGQTLAMVSDRPDPSQSDVVLQFYDLTTKKSKIPNLARDRAPRSSGPDLAAGRQAPALRAQRPRRCPRRPGDLSLGPRQGEGLALTGPGYLEPSFSPDGRYVAATKTSSFGNDLVILDASNGRELLRVTNDGASWAPVWSPVGDAIAFMHIEGQIVDLKLARLEGDAPNWTVKDITDLTEVSGLDGSSRPGWFVPPDQLPTPTPTADPEHDRRAEHEQPERFHDTAMTPTLSRATRGARTASVGSVLCLGLDPDPSAAGRVLGGHRGRRALRHADGRGGRAVRRGHQAEPGLLRGVRGGRDGGPRTDPGVHPGRRSRSSSTPSAPTSARPRRATRSRCSIGSARTP